MSDIKFNINHSVKVKLTQVGINEMKSQHKELISSYDGYTSEFIEPKKDDEGYSTFQMHDLMKRFGHMMTLGLELPFETNIIITEYTT